MAGLVSSPQVLPSRNHVARTTQGGRDLPLGRREPARDQERLQSQVD
jgi:hypothetical protein